MLLPMWKRPSQTPWLHTWATYAFRNITSRDWTGRKKWDLCLLCCRCPIWYCSRTTRRDCLKSSQSDLISYQPYQYPDINLGLTLDVTSPGSCLLRYAQDTKQWNRYNSCYIYRHNQLHLITIRDVEKGEKLILPKEAAHWQGHEDGLLYEYAYVAEHQGGGNIRIAEHF